MSGIAGIIRFDGGPVDAGLIESMTAAMLYRGPDGINHWHGTGASLGHCMLQSTPESLQERQPLCSEQAPLVLVMDGRIDNWEELRAELLANGVLLRDRSDAELVLKAYQRWGNDCLARMDGDFAFAIWNTETRELFCARDRMGLRPFHYSRHGDIFVFASELHPILNLPWVAKVPNLGMVAEWLACDFQSRVETLWAGTFRLVAASRMQVSRDGETTTRYWHPDLSAPLLYKREEEYVEHYLALLTDVVRRTSRSHRPLAYEVSGGLDSSALFAVAARLARQSRLLAPNLHGYTLVFPPDADANELECGRAVGTHLGRPVYEVEASLPALDWYQDRATRYCEFPGFPNSIMSTGLRSTAAKQGCRTLLSGVGGDEWLASRGTGYAEEFAAGRWSNVRAAWLADLRQRGLRRSSIEVLRGYLAPRLPEAVKRSLRTLMAQPADDAGPSDAWLTPGLRQLLDAHRVRSRTDSLNLTATLPRHRSQLSTLYDPYHALAHEAEERLSASLGLDLRRPFLHASLVQFAFSTPDRLRQKFGADKHLHRLAMTGLLPESVRNRQDKAEFSVVFRHALAAVSESTLLAVAQRHQDWVDPTAAIACRRVALAEGPGTGWAQWQCWALLACDKIHA